MGEGEGCVAVTKRVVPVVATRMESSVGTVMVTRVLSRYVFKFCVALIDMVPFYIGVHYLSRYLHIEPFAEHATGTD